MRKKKVEPGALYSYVVPENFSGDISDFLKKKYNYSTRVVNSLKREGMLTLNGFSAPFVQPCCGGDIINVYFPSERPDCEAVERDFGIIYEDEDVLIADKPFGLVTHSTLAHPCVTLASAVYAHWEKTGFRGKVRFVNRLDMDTSGIVVIAKNRYVHHFIQSEAMEGNNEKIYTALVIGCPKELSGIIDAPIARIEENSPERVVRADGKRAVTEYSVVERYEGYSLLKIKLHTGRTHQIRVHMRHIGTPVAGDSLYGGACELIGRQALHAGFYSFLHPRTQKKAEFTALLPPDIVNAIEMAKKHSH